MKKRTLHSLWWLLGLILPLTFLPPTHAQSSYQTYQDYFGDGHTVGIKVTTSSSHNNNDGTQAITGTDLIPDLTGASRFITQATLGADQETMDYITQIGIKPWLAEQFALPPSSYLTTYQSIRETAMAKIAAVHGGNTDTIRQQDYLQFAFYQKVLTEPDILRHKVAFALSQIFVVSIQDGNFFGRGFGTASYYDLLYQGAFGNFRDLLEQVTLHPMMGIYLSHFQNRKADPEAGTLPDENYAREIMQLFTIGLHELHNDGSPKLDINGEVIPTYDIADVQEMAKIFTGLSGSAWDLINKPENTGTPVTPTKGLNHYDLTQPMAMYEEYHETAEKTMIDDSIIPAGQSGMQDISDALDVLFNHANVGPFIAIRLIQQLVKSNPTPAYINRVAMVFNDNGHGVKGDLQAVLTTILTDPEARDCIWIDDPKAGKLMQPIERLTNLFATFKVNSPSGQLWFRDRWSHFPKVEQSFLASPTVFNFFSPFYTEETVVAPNDMVSPEFQILHATSGIHGINLLESSIKTRPFSNRTGVHETNYRLNNDNVNDVPYFDFSTEIALYETNGLTALIDHLDVVICRGQLSDEVTMIITDAVSQIIDNDNNITSEEVIQEILYFIMMSPNYMILK